MGGLKELLERALANANKINYKKTMSASVHREYQEKFEKLIGEPIIWRTRFNTNIKTPQLVVVEKPYENYVVVVKTSFSVDGTENKIRYAILYNSLYCQNDTYETLELDEGCAICVDLELDELDELEETDETLELN